MACLLYDHVLTLGQEVRPVICIRFTRRQLTQFA